MQQTGVLVIRPKLNVMPFLQTGNLVMKEPARMPTIHKKVLALRAKVNVPCKITTQNIYFSVNMMVLISYKAYGLTTLVGVQRCR